MLSKYLYQLTGQLLEGSHPALPFLENKLISVVIKTELESVNKDSSEEAKPSVVLPAARSYPWVATEKQKSL